MKTISIAEFETLVTRNDWQREQNHEVEERFDRQVEVWNEENECLDLIDIPHVRGWTSKTSTLDGIKIIYTECFNYDKYDPDSLSTETDEQNDVWFVEGVVVVDVDGDELNAHELADYLEPDFSKIDYSVLEINHTVDVDVDVDEDEDSEMETFNIEIYNAPSVRFTGELVVSVASSDNQAMGSSYSGQSGRWTEFNLYKTKSGKFVCQQVERTCWQGERDRFSGKVCETLDEVKDFFGRHWLAKDLYLKVVPLAQ